MEDLAKARRDRLLESRKRIYDPACDPIVGRDSPGPNLYPLVTIGNPDLN